ncbi:glycosyltransferase family 1 protein [Tamlana sp. 2201CG12-4]|uniref:glycosyltransferase family 4 protein n=1 Tax=Tamlana sp. 2201CG12-4 TaxID=3112582 RepID=UPI002DBC5862|nr:glycosyltransferase family 1 protein [Tamlana sp. 2201CG12-4]MEC3907599.1 glycosyltransferase family 1 protein [Tamlana sp. 2201CG12-4]
MPNIFLESHNIKNPYFGFGQFNYHIIKGLYNINIPSDLDITLHAKNIKDLKSEFGTYFNYKKYHSFRRYKQLGVRKKYDLWHSLNQNTKIEPYYNIPYVLTVHDVNFVEENPDDQERFLRFKNKLKRSSAITYISNFAKVSTHQHFEVPNVPEYIIYNGNPIREITLPPDYKPALTSKRPFLFSIGEFTERKNFHALVQMLEYLPDFNLIIAGNNKTDYAQNKLANTIKKLNLTNRVIITGKISDLDKQYYLKHCSAFVFPSLREGFGIPPMEAMRFGKPVFLSNNTSLPEIGGKFAFYWKNFDPQYMSEVFEQGMHKYLAQKDEYIKAYTDRANSFDWDISAKQYLQVYKDVLQ